MTGNLSKYTVIDKEKVLNNQLTVTRGVQGKSKRWQSLKSRYGLLERAPKEIVESMVFEPKPVSSESKKYFMDQSSQFLKMYLHILEKLLTYWKNDFDLNIINI